MNNRTGCQFQVGGGGANRAKGASRVTGVNWAKKGILPCSVIIFFVDISIIETSDIWYTIAPRRQRTTRAVTTLAPCPAPLA